jgi:hypothetical protein
MSTDHRIGILIAAALSFVLVSASSALALPVSSGGFDQARACSTTNCAAGTQTFTLDGSLAPVVGSIVLDTDNLEVDFTITVAVLSMVDTVGGEDNGVARIEFTNTTYTGTAVALMGPFATPQGDMYVIGAFASGGIDGTETQFDDTDTPVDTPAGFLRTASLTGGCTVPDVGDAITCGFSFGLTDFDLGVGDAGAGLDPQTRNFEHTLNVAVLPEPGVAVLVGLGMVMIGLRGRPRSRIA